MEEKKPEMAEKKPKRDFKNYIASRLTNIGMEIHCIQQRS